MTSLILFGVFVIFTILYCIRASINGNNLHKCALLITIIIVLIIIVIIPYIRSYIFYQEYTAFQGAIKDIKPSQEYACVDRAIELRREFIKYENNFEKYGIFAPYYNQLKDLKEIQLVNYQLENYG